MPVNVARQRTHVTVITATGARIYELLSILATISLSLSLPLCASPLTESYTYSLTHSQVCSSELVHADRR